MKKAVRALIIAIFCGLFINIIFTNSVFAAPSGGTIAMPENKENPLNPQIIFDLINKHRIKFGLPAFEKDENLCRITNSRAPEIYKEIFVSKNMHQGIRKRNFPYFITENLIYAQSEEKALKWWLNSPIHKRTILGDSKFSCGDCIGQTCVQLFTSYLPK